MHVRDSGLNDSIYHVLNQMLRDLRPLPQPALLQDDLQALEHVTWSSKVSRMGSVDQSEGFRRKGLQKPKEQNRPNSLCTMAFGPRNPLTYEFLRGRMAGGPIMLTEYPTCKVFWVSMLGIIFLVLGRYRRFGYRIFGEPIIWVLRLRSPGA